MRLYLNNSKFPSFLTQVAIIVLSFSGELENRLPELITVSIQLLLGKNTPNQLHLGLTSDWPTNSKAMIRLFHEPTFTENIDPNSIDVYAMK